MHNSLKMVNWRNLLIPSLVLNGAGINTSSKVAIICVSWNNKQIKFLDFAHTTYLWASCDSPIWHSLVGVNLVFSVRQELNLYYFSWISGFKSEMSSVNLVTFWLWKACVPALNDAEVYFRINSWSTKTCIWTILWS
jgi:hypothetical protein